mgnify:CR=1 FL=1
MWVARWLFVGCFLCACLGALQAWAMAEAIEKDTKVHFLGTKPRPLERLVWCSPEEEFRSALERLRQERGDAIAMRMCMGGVYLLQRLSADEEAEREAARVKHEG